MEPGGDAGGVGTMSGSPAMQGGVAAAETDFGFMPLVAMNDAAPVGDLQGFGDLMDKSKTVPYGQRPAQQALSQVLPIKPLHDQVAPALGSLAVGNIGDNAAVAELCEQLRFADETRALARLIRGPVQELEGDELAAVTVARAVDGAHAPTASRTVDLEAVRKEAPRDELRVAHPSRITDVARAAYQSFAAEATSAQAERLCRHQFSNGYKLENLGFLGLFLMRKSDAHRAG